jgi:hypothetical protein
MALASLLFNNRHTTEFRTSGTKDAFFVFDVVIEETHTMNTIVTKREVEEGYDITDHAKAEPTILNISGMISQQPLGLTTGLQSLGLGLATRATSKFAGATAVGGIVAGVIGGKILEEGNGDRVINGFKILQQISKNRVVFDFVTGLEYYKNMILTSVVVNKNKSTGRDISFNATMTEVIIVSSNEVSFDESIFAKNVAATATSKADLGKQATKSASSNGSITYKTDKNYLGGLISGLGR